MKKIILTLMTFMTLTEANAIVGGELVKNFDDPTLQSTVALTIGGRSFCTGFLIDYDMVVTAAHCLKTSRPFKISYGPNIDKTEDHLSVKAFITHEKFSGFSDSDNNKPQYDIGLIKLSQQAPIELKPVAIEDSASLSKGEPIILAGYGLTHPNDLFKQGTGDLRKVTVKFNEMIKVKNEFTFGPDVLKSACKGDSGGPAYKVDSSGKLTVIGVTSRGNPATLNQWGTTGCSGTGFYTSVFQYYDWIMDNGQLL